MKYGVDLSQNQGRMNFNILAEVPNIDIVYVRLGSYNYGHEIDTQAIRNASEVKRIGKRLGYYFPIHFWEGPAAQVKFVNETLNVIGIPADEPFFMDLEIKPPAGVSAVSWTLEWGDRFGDDPLLYTYPSYIRTYLQDVRITKYRLFIANYDQRWPDIIWPFFRGVPYAWQHTIAPGKSYGTAKAPGGYYYKIDLDTFFGD